MTNMKMDQRPPEAANPRTQAIECFGREMEDLRSRIIADLGQRDANYIRRLIRFQRRAELAGRALLLIGTVLSGIFLLPGLLATSWVLGTGLLALAKILDNMEIGHNVMHGQYDFLHDPDVDSRSYEWDNAALSTGWRWSHNLVHHSWTNVIGRDRDVGYGFLRVHESQPWTPIHLGQPLWAAGLSLMFEWGIAMHGMETERVGTAPGKGGKSLLEMLPEWRPALAKMRRMALRDYILHPAMAGPFFLPVLLGNLVANVARNVWAFVVIFCGHFPLATAMFEERDLERETRAEWYHRQVLGSANISGGPLLHLLSGNLSHQIEHHLFPDIPAHRYAEISGEVRAACERHGLPYLTGSLPRQFASVVRRLCRMALPPRPRDRVAAAAA